MQLWKIRILPFGRSTACASALNFPARMLLLFALLNLADFALTRYLLEIGGATVVESNPLAAWWLSHLGWFGLAGFKIATAITVAISAVIIVQRRLVAGNFVLMFACTALAMVVAYSGYLCATFRRGPYGFDATNDATALADADRLALESRRSEAYHLVLRRVVQEMCAHKCTLGEGVDRLAVMERTHDTAFLQGLHAAYPEFGASERLGVMLIANVALELADSTADLRTVPALWEEFRSLYGTPPPAGMRAMQNRRPANSSRRMVR